MLQQPVAWTMQIVPWRLTLWICLLGSVATVEGLQMEEEKRLRTAVQKQLESLSVAKARKAAHLNVALQQ
jgi:hypothetical protein